MIIGDDVLGDARLASAARLCDRLRQATKRELNLETSAGVSTSKLLAKTVAGLHKPFQQTVLADTPNNRRLVLPDDLPLRKVYGIGHSTAQQLASAGVATVGDLRDFSGPSSISDIERLRALARGDDASLEHALEVAIDVHWHCRDRGGRRKLPGELGGSGVQPLLRKLQPRRDLRGWLC